MTLSRSEISHRGGVASAKVQRDRALASYYENPNVCEHCGEVIEVGNRKAAVARKRRFCSVKCASIDTNSKRKKPKFYCKECGSLLRSKNRIKVGICRNCESFIMVASRSKAKATRGTINAQARWVYYHSGQPLVCAECGYNYHIHIAHIKGISKFKPTAKLSEMNDISNLKALCPNHHWEFDHPKHKKGKRP